MSKLYLDLENARKEKEDLAKGLKTVKASDKGGLVTKETSSSGSTISG